MVRYITPNDDQVVGTTDVERINNAIRLAKEQKVNCVLIPRLTLDKRDVWEIDETIILPSDITVYLDDCILRTPKTAVCNIFRNENFYDQSTYTMEGEQHDINIIGLGSATLDGGEYNGVSETTGGKNGLPSIINNSMIMMSNVRDVKIKNLKIKRHRWWAICFLYARKVHVCGIDYEADLTYVDENGIRRFDRTALKEYEAYVKNADGIDLRNGCHDFLIENITGLTEDDSVALTTLQGWCKDYFVEGKDNDIHDVIIKDVATDCFACGNVRLTCADGNKIYNISMDGIYDRAPLGCGYVSGGTVKINDSYYCRIRHAKAGELYNISINNVVCSGQCAVRLEQTGKNITINNVFVQKPQGYAVAHFPGYGYLKDNNGPFEYENIFINNVMYAQPPEVDFAIKFENCVAKNVKVGAVAKDVTQFIQQVENE